MLAIEFNREYTMDATFRQFQSSYHIHIRYIFADALFSAHRNSAEVQQRGSRECNSPTRRLRDKNVSNQGRVLLSELFPSNDSSSWPTRG